MLRNAVPAIARTLAAVTLAAGLAVGGTGTAAAYTLSDSFVQCRGDTGTFSINLPINSPQRISQFAFRIDGGAWQYTPLFLTRGGDSWVWNGVRWIYRGFGANSAVLWDIGGGHYIEAFERRTSATGTGAWFALERSCFTTTMLGDPIRYS